MKKYKGLILTVGTQGEQIKFSIGSIEPEYLGLIGTDTPQCKKTIDEIYQYSKLPVTKVKIEYIEDNPNQVKDIIHKFLEIYEWMKKEGLDDKEIAVDPTGGRKWMSAGIYIISSLKGLNLVYVDAPFVNGKPDSQNMKLVYIGNAYEQTGFLEEGKADELFNKYNFGPAIKIYEFLSQKLSDPRRVEIKKQIAEEFNWWNQFSFEKAYKNFLDAYEKIRQYGILTGLQSKLEGYIKILEILKQNETSGESYFKLLKNPQFSEKILLNLIATSERYAEINHYDFAVILLYRTLELIAQIKLAQRDIDTGDINEEIKEKYNEEFKKITKEIFGAESEIPDKIALLHSWILLYCLKDEIVINENIKFLKGMRDQVNIRDLLWIEHKNKSASEDDYLKFKRYVEHWISKFDRDFKEKLEHYKFIKF
jgi:CRISPR-associated protein (TIGR02710 family)